MSGLEPEQIAIGPITLSARQYIERRMKKLYAEADLLNAERDRLILEKTKKEAVIAELEDLLGSCETEQK